MMPSAAPLRLAIATLCLLIAAACASGTDDDAGGGTRDAGPRRDSGRGDASGGDAGDFDAGGDAGGGGEFCAGVTCDPFQYCDGGECRDYPACRGDGTCDRPGDFCHSRVCVPGDVDIDGDGHTASTDCDETDPEVYPGQDEICNSTDDDCDTMMDEGDPTELCLFYPGGGICMGGSCGCPNGQFDLDRTVPGCECSAAPPIGDGLSCATPIDLGTLTDAAQMVTATGNVLPDDREVWYRFSGEDLADTTCDNYHVDVRFLANPDNAFEFTVFRGSCATAACDDSGFTAYRWATDLRQTIASVLTGQCPCWSPPSAPVANVSRCENDTSDYFVRVRRVPGGLLTCASYILELSNGVYDTPPP